LEILGCLYFYKTQRFSEIKIKLNGIAPKTLSKELKDLEINRMVVRLETKTKPRKINYELTPIGESLNYIISSMGKWSNEYRKKIKVA
jgi:DNA-binding HxlR family transcriptional regulator